MKKLVAAKPALVQIIGEQGRTAAQRAEAKLALKKGTQVVEIFCRDMSKKGSDDRTH